jgi:Sulfotransferase domain
VRASLWRSLRDRLLQQKRVVKRLRKLHAAGVVVVSHPKSGRTWLSTMISHVYHQQYAIPETQIIRFDNFHRIDPKIPRIFFTHDSRRYSRRPALAGPARYVGKKVVLLVRDPRDVVVSSYFHVTRRYARRQQTSADLAGGDEAEALFAYVRDIGLPKLVQFLNRWQHRLASIEQALLVRYEDLRAAPAAELGRVLAFIDRPFPADVIAAAVRFASFDNLRAKEASGFFETSRLHPGDGADPDSFKVRRGKVGGYRDYFTAEQLAWIEATLAEQLPPGLGYLDPAPEPPPETVAGAQAFGQSLILRSPAEDAAP